MKKSSFNQASISNRKNRGGYRWMLTVRCLQTLTVNAIEKADLNVQFEQVLSKVENGHLQVKGR